MKKFNYGLLAEHIVKFIYRLKFYRILAHRLRFYSGEVDLIATRGNTIVFIEVKARSSNLDDILVSNFQQQRIKRAAEAFLAKRPEYSKYLVRFDLAIVRPYSWPEIIKQAW